MIAEAIFGLKAMIDALSLYALTSIGPLPIGNGIAIYSGGGSSGDYLDRSMTTELTLVINSKHAEQQQALSAQEVINAALTVKGMIYPSGIGWAIRTIDGTTPPNYTGIQDTGEYIYSSILRVMIYNPRVNL
jgi:hypothetical protein